MERNRIWLGIICVSCGLAAATHADSITSTSGQVNVTTTQPATVTISPNATDSTAPGAVAPTVSANPTPVEDQTAQSQDMSGTVQSVDRRNHSLVVQDPQGKDIGISMNNSWHIYRRGEEVQYRDVEPNDVVELRYRT